MVKKLGIWIIGVPDLCKRAAARCRRAAYRFAEKLPIFRQENPQEVVRVTNGSHTSHVDFAGKAQELSEFIKVLSVGDRIRVFCDDGVILAEKVSQTRFKEIHAETNTELVH
jgi:hypothetical protein